MAWDELTAIGSIAGALVLLIGSRQVAESLQKGDGVTGGA